MTGDRTGLHAVLHARLKQAAALHQQGNLGEAAHLYRNILQQQPDHFDALHLLGVIATQTGQAERAVELIGQAIRLNPSIAAAHSNLGNALQDLRRPRHAIAAYTKAIALNPTNPDIFVNRGNALKALNRLEEALASFDQAIALRAGFSEAMIGRGGVLLSLNRFEEALVTYDAAISLSGASAETFNNRGNALHGLKRFEEALATYDQAIALKPDFAQALNNRGTVLHSLNRLDEALSNYDQAIALSCTHPETFTNRGNTLRQLKRLDEAVRSYDQAITLRPSSLEALSNRGLILHDLNRLPEALASYNGAIALNSASLQILTLRGDVLRELNQHDKALADYDRALTLDPNSATLLNRRANALKTLNRLDEAVASYDAAIALKPDFAEAFANRGIALKALNRRDDAAASYDKALAIRPDLAEAQIGRCIAELPVLYEAEAEIAERRAAYGQSLRALCARGGADGRVADFANAVGFAQPFFLAYQGHNDRDLQALYGAFVCQATAERYPAVVLAPRPGQDQPVRVGIVSGFFRYHSNWKLPIKGWLSQLDRRRFQIFGYHTGAVEDAETKTAAALCDRFVQGPLTFDRWRSEIISDAPHVLIYPEIGMDPVAVRLAAQRLAPVQCNSWGHPETSGFPTLDYYLSSELMEPPDGQDHYTERLVRLPNLSVYCEPTDPPSVSVTRQELGLRSSATVYWSGQSLFKYLPQFDDVYPRIAREVGDCQFVFIEYQRGPQVTELFRQRLDRAFASFGLKAADHCVFLPRLDKHKFVAAIGQCDVILDSIGWSGCNSILESLPNDLPIVTLPGPLMRGRHALAILKMMDVTETIARTTDEYISIAAGLARDVEWGMAVKAKIAANKHRLYYDDAAITGLEQFLDHVARHGPEAIPAAGSSSRLPLQSAA
jgi:protein O-GlcNAc transferase